MRTIAIGIFAATLGLAAAPAPAQDAAISASSSNIKSPPTLAANKGPVVTPNITGNPVTGVGVSVESTPAGIVTRYNGPAEAEAACTGAGGTYRNAASKLTCLNPTTPLPGIPITSSASNIKSPPNLTATGGAPQPQRGAAATPCSNTGARAATAGTGGPPKPQQQSITTSCSNKKDPPNLTATGAGPAGPAGITGNPIGGVGVSVETDPGGIVTRHADAADAQAACLAAGGTFQNAAGKRSCLNPKTPLVVATGTRGQASTPSSH